MARPSGEFLYSLRQCDGPKAILLETQYCRLRILLALPIAFIWAFATNFEVCRASENTSKSLHASSCVLQDT